jgi:hypothetical protein
LCASEVLNTSQFGTFPKSHVPAGGYGWFLAQSKTGHREIQFRPLRSETGQRPNSGAAGGEKVKVMAGERELTTGLLSKDASFRLIVSGNVGVKEIERLIKKLELDKEILADQDDEAEDDVFK